MPLTSKTCLALAVLVAVHCHAQHGRTVGAGFLEQRFQLAKRMLEPVLQLLVRHGFLRSLRGARGGYVVESPESLTVGRILRALEPCLVSAQPLQLLQPLLEDMLASPYEALLAQLDQVTLADLAHRAVANGIAGELEPFLDFSI